MPSFFELNELNVKVSYLCLNKLYIRKVYPFCLVESFVLQASNAFAMMPRSFSTTVVHVSLYEQSSISSPFL